MSKRNTIRAVACIALITAAGVLACKSSATDSTQAAKSKSEKAGAPWTKEFQSRAILIADEVSIEGPPGLIDHVAYKQSPEQHYAAKTTSDGFLQEVSTGANTSEPIWIQIDNLRVNALRSGRWLERLADGPVRIHAHGRAYWKNLDTGQEQQAETIELVGAPPK